LKDEHVFITGSGSGIGRLVAIKLADMGCKVSVVDIDLNAAEETARIITENGQSAVAIKCDVTSIEDIVKAG
jgi:NAD(P)-dependent dehydrogenase (short-subunit alcohol dehydrogenase family)